MCGVRGGLQTAGTWRIAAHAGTVAIAAPAIAVRTDELVAEIVEILVLEVLVVERAHLRDGGTPIPSVVARYEPLALRTGFGLEERADPRLPLILLTVLIEPPAGLFVDEPRPLPDWRRLVLAREALQDLI